jgi:glucose/arabinose dehydrogenase
VRDRALPHERLRLRPRRSFYASELATPLNFTGGDVVKIPFDSPDTHSSLAGRMLTTPAGVTVGPDGAVYVSNFGTSSTGGQVVRLIHR